MVLKKKDFLTVNFKQVRSFAKGNENIYNLKIVKAKFPTKQ